MNRMLLARVSQTAKNVGNGLKPLSVILPRLPIVKDLQYANMNPKKGAKFLKSRLRIDFNRSMA